MQQRNPFKLFESWYNDWKTLLPKDNPQGLFYSAMSLSTFSSLKGPQSRIVLLKEVIQPDGFIFASNYSSAKATEITKDPRVSLCFYWGERQIRVTGTCTKTSPSLSDSVHPPLILRSGTAVIDKRGFQPLLLSNLVRLYRGIYLRRGGERLR
jgi:pyridoxine/pyridoxamine 5'-phosphate oxidase